MSMIDRRLIGLWDNFGDEETSLLIEDSEFDDLLEFSTVMKALPEKKISTGFCETVTNNVINIYYPLNATGLPYYYVINDDKLILYIKQIDKNFKLVEVLVSEMTKRVEK